MDGYFSLMLAELPSAFHAIRDAFARHGESNRVVIVVLVGSVLGLVVAAVVHEVRARVGREVKASEDPERLFVEVLGRLGLERGERRLLRRLARGARLAHPVEALLSPGLLDWAVDLWAAERPGAVGAWERERIAGIRERLFRVTEGF